MNQKNVITFQSHRRAVSGLSPENARPLSALLPSRFERRKFLKEWDEALSHQPSEAPKGQPTPSNRQKYRRRIRRRAEKAQQH